METRDTTIEIFSERPIALLHKKYDPIIKIMGRINTRKELSIRICGLISNWILSPFFTLSSFFILSFVTSPSF